MRLLKFTCRFCIIVSIVISIVSCNDLGKNKAKSSSYIQKFNDVKNIAKHRYDDLFGVFKQDLTEDEAEALEFLYAYMPLSDLADYNGEFFLKHVRATFLSRDEIEWAKSIPDDIFMHFILPHRINNENLDTARIVLFNDLKNRVKALSMYDAAIEVNHWCHEKVEYHSADIRTSSPLATMKTAYGRCGEESTFTVAALRSVCIPARQVYTPRWAHSDDNHAWVEVWIDGEWYFLGACEPQPILNFGWFNQPASRAMLVHARVFGEYNGNEEVNVSTSQYVDINVTERYAKTFKQFIKVIDTKGMPVPNVKVEYQLYNYAEFYSIATKISDKDGMSSLTTGFGDLLIWVSNNESYGYKKIKIGEEDTVAILLSNPDFNNIHWELMPPVATNHVKVDITEEQEKENKSRLQYEDSVRNNYISTFITKEEFLKIKADENLWKYIKKSRGNYNEIIDLIVNCPKNRYKWLEPLLKTIAEKDLRDTKADILRDNLEYSYANTYPTECFVKYILNPRIANEMLVAYKGYLLNKFGKTFTDSLRKDMYNLIAWVKDSITVVNGAQAYSLPISPIGVCKLRVSDSRSRDIFFVAVCRSCGIPARLEQGTNTPQYLYKEKWIDVYFDGTPKEYKKFNILFKANKKNLKFTPQYYHHFTLARFENNRFVTLELGEYKDIDKIGNLQLRGGYYRLITSNRLVSGKILVDIKFFEITKDTVIGLDFPEKEIRNEVLGTINLDKILNTFEGGSVNLKEIQNNNNIVIAIIEPDKEPSKHVLNDLQKVKTDLNKLTNSFVFIIQKENLSATFQPTDYGLPIKSEIIVVNKNPKTLLNINIDTNKNNALPMVLIVSPKGGIIYLSEGYRIGIGNDILKIL